jgi:hypothetical protein
MPRALGAAEKEAEHEAKKVGHVLEHVRGCGLGCMMGYVATGATESAADLVGG